MHVLLLLDVSGSTQPHIERIVDASQTALSVLAPADRVVIVVFDTRTQLKLPFRSDHNEISENVHSIIRSGSFNRHSHHKRPGRCGKVRPEARQAQGPPSHRRSDG